MKSTVNILAAGILAAGLTAFGQATNQTPPQVQSQGRGGALHAWGDKNKDGICDVTGKAVGQGRRAMAGRGRMAGKGMAAGRGQGRGMYRCCGNNVQAAPSSPAK